MCVCEAVYVCVCASPFTVCRNPHQLEPISCSLLLLIKRNTETNLTQTHTHTQTNTQTNTQTHTQTQREPVSLVSVCVRVSWSKSQPQVSQFDYTLVHGIRKLATPCLLMRHVLHAQLGHSLPLAAATATACCSLQFITWG